MDEDEDFMFADDIEGELLEYLKELGWTVKLGYSLVEEDDDEEEE